MTIRWRRTLVLLAGVGALVAAGLALSHRMRGPSHAALSEVENAYARGDWQAAMSTARTMLAQSPRDTGALRLMARAAARGI